MFTENVQDVLSWINYYFLLNIQICLLLFTDDGLLRMYLRGRALNLYAPSNLGDFDIAKLGQTPKETLKLEWVYPFELKFQN